MVSLRSSILPYAKTCVPKVAEIHRDAPGRPTPGRRTNAGSSAPRRLWESTAAASPELPAKHFGRMTGVPVVAGVTFMVRVRGRYDDRAREQNAFPAQAWKPGKASLHAGRGAWRHRRVEYLSYRSSSSCLWSHSPNDV
jgi:hypothetical protein